MNSVVIEGWNPGFKKIGFANLLREYANYSLSSAKKAVDLVLAGEPLLVQIANSRAESFILEATELGAICRSLEGDEV